MTTNPIRFTGDCDRNGIPIAVGDLVRMGHFTARSGRKIYLYKKVMIINDRVYLVAVGELGLKPTANCYKCLISDAVNIEVLDGDSCNHPLDGRLICWWERKQLNGGDRPRQARKNQPQKDPRD